MSTTAIVMLVLGVIFFGASFFLPDGRKNDEKENSVKVDEQLIKDMVNKEIMSAKEKIDEMVDETVSYSVEKTERQLEKLSNEKIMAVDEYSETVLKKINDNHQEAVFLYDMLNEKDEKLKTSGEEIKAKSEQLKEKDRELEVKEEVLKARTEDLNADKEEFKAEILEKTDKADSFVPFIPERVVLKDTEEKKTPAVTESPAKKTRTVKKPVTGKQDARVTLPVKEAEPVKTEKKSENISENSVELHFDRDNDGKKNSNEQIRRMHEEGKSNMAIAKELGLGVGEVKLVIDLFANKK